MVQARRATRARDQNSLLLGPIAMITVLLFQIPGLWKTTSTNSTSVWEAEGLLNYRLYITR